MDRVVSGTLANLEVRHQFGRFIQSHEHPLIANFGRVILANVASFLSNVGPDFVALQMLERQVPHLGIHERLAAPPSANEQRHEGVYIQSGDALRAPQRVAFDQQLESEHGFVLGDVHRIQRSRVRFRVGPLALRAAKSEQSVSVFSNTVTN